MTNTFSTEDFHASGMGIEDVQITVLAWSSFTFQYKLNLLLSVVFCCKHFGNHTIPCDAQDNLQDTSISSVLYFANSRLTLIPTQVFACTVLFDSVFYLYIVAFSSISTFFLLHSLISFPFFFPYFLATSQHIQTFKSEVSFTDIGF